MKEPAGGLRGVLQSPTAEELGRIDNRSLLSVAMQMTFHQSLESVILFESWRTSGWLDYSASCLLVVLMGCFAMFVSSANKRYIREVRGRRTEGAGPGKRVVFASMVMTALQYLLHYLMMLIAMTFNWGLFVSVILGLSVGYALFELGPEVKEECVCNRDVDFPSCC